MVMMTLYVRQQKRHRYKELGSLIMKRIKKLTTFYFREPLFS